MAVKGIRKGMDPRHVAQTILRVVRSRWPSPRYPVGLQARATRLAHGVLPAGAFERGAVGRRAGLTWSDCSEQPDLLRRTITFSCRNRASRLRR